MENTIDDKIFKDAASIPEGFVYRGQRGRYPWWAKSVDKITTPVDMTKWKRTKTNLILMMIGAKGEDAVAQEKKARERMIEKMIHKDPGSRLQDFALHYASETFFATGVDNFKIGFILEFLKIREAVGKLIHLPGELGVPKWQGSEQEEWSLCQGFTYARRWGWNVAMTAEDNFCVPSSGSHGWVDFSDEELLESQIRQGWHKDEASERRLQKFTRELFSNNRPAKETFKGFILSPLPKSIIVPDTVLIYGNGEQITHIIQALVYDGRNFPTSSFWGFGESCLKGGLMPFLTQTPQIVIPGTGDRTFSGVFDYEIAIGLPGTLIHDVADNLFKTGGRLNMGVPVKTLLPRGIKAKLTPGFDFLRKTMKEGKS